MSFTLLVSPRLGAYTCRPCALRLAKGAKGVKYTKAAIEARWHSTAPAANVKPSKQKPGRTQLPTTPARTRFAPSPTGFLHLGSLRTALFNYLLARRTGGQFLLRIEDTDQKRTVPGAEERLFQDLKWAGLEWDEGPLVGGPYGPYRQSDRSALYKEHADKLLQNGHAYRCFCSTERLNALAEQRHKMGLATDYDRTCAHIPRDEAESRATNGEKFVVRLKVPDQYPAYEDLIYGTFKPLKKRRGDGAFEDPILLKSDGLPTYHLANVVDDHHMKITHVIRGLEWMPSTPKHIAMYNAFGWTPPQFAHVGLLVDEQGNKLSKRNFDTDITAFKDMEIFPETLTNFAALLGWSHSEKSDVMDLEKLVEKFSLKFTKGNTTVTFGKLQFLQRKHAAERAKAGGEKLKHMVQAVSRLLQDAEGPYHPAEWSKMTGPNPDSYVERVIVADAENYTNANEFLYRHSYLFGPLKKPSSSYTPPEDVVSLCKGFAQVQDWNKDGLMAKMHEIIDGRPEGKAGAKDVYHYLRMALTGQEKGMRIYDIMEILGQKETLKRLGV